MIAPRVSFIVDSDTWGGAEVYVGYLLRAARENGWEPSLVCSEPVTPFFRGALPECDVRTMPLVRHCASAPQVRTALLAQSPHAVFVNLVDPASNAAALQAALSVAPTVATLHLAGDTGGGPGNAQLRSLYGRTKAVLTSAAGARRQLIDELGVPAHRTAVVPNGVNVPAEVSHGARLRPPRIGSVGRLTSQKGFDVLIRSIASLTGDGVALECVIAGEGRDAQRLERQAAGLPVKLCGFIADVPQFLTTLDIFCLASRHESLPLALLEAMASGLPCIATDVGGVRDAVGSGALLVSPEDPCALSDAVRTLLEDRWLAAALGRQARQTAVRDFNAAVMARRTFQVLRTALA